MLHSSHFFVLFHVFEALERNQDTSVKYRFLENGEVFVRSFAILKLKTHELERLVLLALMLQRVKKYS